MKKIVLLSLSVVFLSLGLFHAPSIVERVSDVYIEEIETSTLTEGVDVLKTNEKANSVLNKGLIFIGVMFLLCFICFVWGIQT